MWEQVVCDDGRLKIEYDKGEVRNMNGCWMTICHHKEGVMPTYMCRSLRLGYEVEYAFE